MLNVDICSWVGLTKLFAKEMVEEGEGYILQLASIGAYQATPTYAAKAFVLHYSEALDYEVASTGVSCATLPPRVTKSGVLGSVWTRDYSLSALDDEFSSGG